MALTIVCYSFVWHVQVTSQDGFYVRDQYSTVFSYDCSMTCACIALDG